MRFEFVIRHIKEPCQRCGRLLNLIDKIRESKNRWRDDCAKQTELLQLARKGLNDLVATRTKLLEENDQLERKLEKLGRDNKLSKDNMKILAFVADGNDYDEGMHHLAAELYRVLEAKEKKCTPKTS